MKARPAKAFFCVCVGVALTAGWATLSQRRVERDNRGCTIGQPPRATVAILLDASDALSTSDERRLKLIKDEVMSKAAPDTLVMVAALRDNEYEPVTWVGELCISPEPEESGALLDYFHGNPRQLHKAWTKKVQDRFGKLLATGFTRATPQQGSPISQALFIMARTPEFSSSEDRRLLLVSDMLERTSRFSLYRRTGISVKTALDRRPEWRGALDGFDVVVFRVNRQDTPLQSTPRFWRYWSEFSTRADAQSWQWR